jgi:hypothetical protein
VVRVGARVGFARQDTEVTRMALQEGSLGAVGKRVGPRPAAAEREAGGPALPPESVLSVLEADQLVAAKQKARFGPAPLSRGARGLLWGLRVYVIAMLIMVAVQVMHALHGGH